MSIDARNPCLADYLWALMQDIWSSDSLFANNKGTDQPAHSCSLVSAFVTRSLESIISKLFLVVSVAEQASLGKTWSETPKAGFLALRPIIS